MKEFAEERERKDRIQAKNKRVERLKGFLVYAIMVVAVIMFITAFLVVFEFVEKAPLFLAVQFFILLGLFLMLWRVPLIVKRLKKELRNYENNKR